MDKYGYAENEVLIALNYEHSKNCAKDLGISLTITVSGRRAFVLKVNDNKYYFEHLNDVDIFLMGWSAREVTQSVTETKEEVR